MVINNTQRVVIRNVCPQVKGGQYRAKAVIHQPVLLSADVFAEGHDSVEAFILIRHSAEKKWTELPMHFKGNDRWELEFEPQATGIYQFMVQGWVNHLVTWQKGLKKKFKAAQDISLELQIGAGLLDEAAAYAAPVNKKAFRHYSALLANAKDREKAFALATAEEATALMRSGRDKKRTSASPTFELDVERTKAGFSTWYELFPRSAAAEPGRHGTFADVQILLPRIAQMGFDTLYFPPIHPIGELKRKGRNNALEAQPGDPGSPWAIGSSLGGHKSIHPELGTLKDFQALVKAAKKYDIEIAMDIAFQCAPDHPYVKQHPQWFKWRPDGTVQYAENPPKKYEDILPFDFETEDGEGLWNELKSIFEFWIGKGIRIFRIDNPHTKAFAFWEWVIGEIRKEHPDVIFLAEAFTRPRIMEELALLGFNQSYTYFTWRNTKAELETYLTELTQTELQHYFRPNFWPNTPDILPPALAQGGENMHIIRLLLAATLSSNYGLYGPVYDFGMNESAGEKEEYVDNEKYEIRHWDWSAETRIREIITLVNRIRKQNSALQSTGNIAFVNTTNENVICYIKSDKKKNNHLIIAVNLDPHQSQSADVNILSETIGLLPGDTYTVRDLLSQDRYHWKHGPNYVRLDPWQMPAHILKVENNTPEL